MPGPQMPSEIQALIQQQGGGQESPPEVALKNLSMAVAELPLSRREHQLLDHCVEVLDRTIKQWRAMQESPSDPEDPKKLLTEGDAESG